MLDDLKREAIIKWLHCCNIKVRDLSELKSGEPLLQIFHALDNCPFERFNGITDARRIIEIILCENYDITPDNVGLGFHKCWKGNEIEIAKVAVLSLGLLAENLIQTSDHYVRQSLESLEHSVQATIGELLDLVISKRDGWLQDLHDLIEGQQEDSFQISRRNLNELRNRLHTISSPSHLEHDSPLKRLLESPQIAIKLAIKDKEKENKLLRNKLEIEENKNCDLLNKILLMEQNLLKKDRENADFKSRIRDLQNASLNTTTDQQMEEVDRLQQQVQNLKIKVVSYDALEKDYKEAVDEISQLKEKLSRAQHLETTLRKMDKDLKDAVEQKDCMLFTVQQLQDEINNKSTAVQELHKELAAMKELYHEISQKPDVTSPTVPVSLGDNLGEVLMEELKNQVGSLKEMNSVINENLSQSEKDRENLKIELQACSLKVSDFEKEIFQLKETLKQKNEELHIKQTNWTEDSSRLLEAVRHVESQRDCLNDALGEARRLLESKADLLEQRTNESKHLSSENASLIHKLEDMNRKMSEVKSVLEQKNEAIFQDQQKLQSFEKEILSKDLCLKELEEEICNCKQALTEKEKCVNDLSVMFEGARCKLEDQIRALEDNLGMAERNLSLKEISLRDLEVKFQETNIALQHHETELSECHNQKKLLAAELESTKELIKEKEEVLEKFKQEKESLLVNLQLELDHEKLTRAQEMEFMSKELLSCKESMKKLNETLLDTESQYSSADLKVKELTCENEKLLKKNDQASLQIRKLEDDIRNFSVMEVSLVDFKQNAERLFNEGTKLRKEIEKCRSDLKNCENEKLKLEQLLQVKTKDVEELLCQLDDKEKLQNDLNCLMSEHKKMKDDLATQFHLNEELTKEVTDLKTENISLKSNYEKEKSSLQMSLHDCTKDIEKLKDEKLQSLEEKVKNLDQIKELSFSAKLLKSNLENEKAEKLHEIEHLTSEIASLLVNCQQKTEENTKLISTVEILKSEKKNLESQVESLRIEAESKEKLDAALVTIATLEEEKISLEQLCEQKTTENEDLSCHVSSLQADKDSLSLQLEQLNLELKKEIEMNKETLGAMLKNVSAIEEEKKSLQKAYEEKVELNEIVSSKLTTLEAEKRKFELQVEELTASLHKDTENVEKLNDKLSSISALEEQNLQLQEECALKEKENTELIGSLAAVKAENENLCTELGRLKAQIAENNEKGTTAETPVLSLRMELEKMKIKNEELVAQQETLKSLVSDFQGDARDSQDKIREENLKLLQEMSMLKKRVISLTTENDNIKAKSQEKDDAMSKMSQELSNMTLEMNSKFATAETLQRKYEKAKKMLIEQDKHYREKLERLKRNSQELNQKLQQKIEEKASAENSCQALEQKIKETASLEDNFQAQQQEIKRLRREKLSLEAQLKYSEDLINKSRKSLSGRSTLSATSVLEFKVPEAPRREFGSLENTSHYYLRSRDEHKPFKNCHFLASSPKRQDSESDLRKALGSENHFPLEQPSFEGATAYFLGFGDDSKALSNISMCSNSSQKMGGLPPRIKGNQFICEDEEGEFMNHSHLSDLKSGRFLTEEDKSKRLSELLRRNNLVRPHLRSCYPVETQGSAAALADISKVNDSLKDPLKRKHSTDSERSTNLQQSKKQASVSQKQDFASQTPRTRSSRKFFNATPSSLKKLIPQRFRTPKSPRGRKVSKKLL